VVDVAVCCIEVAAVCARGWEGTQHDAGNEKRLIDGEGAGGVVKAHFK